MATAEISLDDLATRVSELSEQFAWLTGLVDPESTQNRVAELEQQMQLPGFWDDQTNAAKINAEYKRLERKMQRFEQLTTKVEDLSTMIEMAREADDDEAAEIVTEVSGDADELSTVLGELQEDALFTGDYDAGNAVVGIQSGEGGVDAQDFAEMLQRMYLRFWNQRDFKVTQTAQTDGDEAGIRSASFLVEGDYAYGIMNAEAGVHRLVRLSPFDSANRRHTSFAQIEVSPYIDEDVGDVEVDDADIRVDTYRASGAGGQHVNKTDSAIRITHEPTGIVVQCQNERSQHQNRDTAMKMLRSQLFELELQKREAEIAAEKGDAQNVGYGSQIRSYVLHPYQMVKDLRTKHETGNVQAVLDGALDDFVRALLLQQAQDRSEQ